MGQWLVYVSITDLIVWLIERFSFFFVAVVTVDVLFKNDYSGGMMILVFLPFCSSNHVWLTFRVTKVMTWFYFAPNTAFNAAASWDEIVKKTLKKASAFWPQQSPPPLNCRHAGMHMHGGITATMSTEFDHHDLILLGCMMYVCLVVRTLQVRVCLYGHFCW